MKTKIASIILAAILAGGASGRNLEDESAADRSLVTSVSNVSSTPSPVSNGESTGTRADEGLVQGPAQEIGLGFGMEVVLGSGGSGILHNGRLYWVWRCFVDTDGLLESGPIPGQCAAITCVIPAWPGLLQDYIDWSIILHV